MNEINISRLVDTARLRPFHLWLTGWCLLAMMADGFDLLNASIAGPALIKEWGISRASLGPVFSASLVGFFVGAPFFGYLGDRFGRRLAIITSLILVGVTTLACAWATNLQELLWLRFLSGLGLGGVLPNVIALNAEFAPKRLRATVLVVIAMGISLGGTVPGIVGVTLMPTYGWPVIFVVGGIVPIVVGLCMIFAIPDSIKFMVLQGRHDEAVARLARKLDPRLTIEPRHALCPRPCGGKPQDTRFTPRSVPPWLGSGDGTRVADLRAEPDGQQSDECLATDDRAEHRAQRRARRLRRLALSARRHHRRVVHGHLDRPLRAKGIGCSVRARRSGPSLHRHARNLGVPASRYGLLFRLRHHRHANGSQRQCRFDLPDRPARQWRRLCARCGPRRLDRWPAARQHADEARNAP